MTNSSLWLLATMFDLEMEIERRVAQIGLPTTTRIVTFSVSLVARTTASLLIFHFIF